MYACILHTHLVAVEANADGIIAIVFANRAYAKMRPIQNHVFRTARHTFACALAFQAIDQLRLQLTNYIYTHLATIQYHY